MKILFAGCARNCAAAVSRNVAALLNAADDSQVDDVRIYIAENDSNDSTRDVIKLLAARDDRVVPVLLDSLCGRFPTREAQIAFCRDQLLKRLIRENSEGLYCPVDLDMDFSLPDFMGSFLESCKLVEAGVATAVFPSAVPYYYDIHALRADQWCLGSCWKEVQDSGARGALWSLMVNIRYISCRQRHYLSVGSTALGLIPVLSAFGGMGIYSLRKVAEAGAFYSSPALSQQDLRLCEHVVFNSYLDLLFVNSGWLVSAPVEHIKFRLMSAPEKGLLIAQAIASDIRRIAQKFFK